MVVDGTVVVSKIFDLDTVVNEEMYFEVIVSLDTGNFLEEVVADVDVLVSGQ